MTWHLQHFDFSRAQTTEAMQQMHILNVAQRTRANESVMDTVVSFMICLICFGVILISKSWAVQIEVCPEGMYGEDCSLECSPACNMGCEKMSGNCYAGCQPGWQGEHCDQRCEDYKYGPNCQRTCGHCLLDQKCDPETGICKEGCMAGWRERKCNESCHPFSYGINCSSKCGHCKLGKACNMATGTCNGGCMPGWKGDTCDEACGKNKFGTDCALTCGNCFGNTTCDPQTGDCPTGCQPGWMSPKCNQKCPVNSFGIHCRGSCGKCANGSCHHVTGSCLHGCTPGWNGLQCTEKCEKGTYGPDCLKPCGQCNNMSSCDPVNGICTSGCREGWYGIYCLQECTPGYYGENCKFICGRCAEDADCDRITGICLGGCESGWTGDRCSQVLLQTAEPSVMQTTVVPVLVVCVVGLFLALASTVLYFVFVRPRRLALGSRFYSLTNRGLDDTDSHIYEQIQAGPWEINKANLILTSERLGHGHFGQVRKGFVKRDRQHKVPVAIKSLKGNASVKDKDDFMNELNILKKVGQHSNVVCLVGACHVQGTLYLALEFCNYGDLRTYLRKSRKIKHNLYANTKLITPLQQAVLLKFALDAATGLAHLAENQIIHRDVAARNVLLDDNLIAKVADFGLSKNENTYVKTSHSRVPVRWMALESLFSNTYTTHSDVWSFGVFLWEVVTLGGTPYHSIDTQELCNLLRRGFRMRRPRLCEPALYAMMLQCWHENPECRPSLTDLVMRLERMLEDSQVYMNLHVSNEFQYAEIDNATEDKDAT